MYLRGQFIFVFCRLYTSSPIHRGSVWVLPVLSLLVTNTALQRANAENSKQIFPEKELRGQSPNFHIHVSVSDLYIPTIDLPILLQENILTDPVHM
jgi:hypothetical protein